MMILPVYAIRSCLLSALIILAYNMLQHFCRPMCLSVCYLCRDVKTRFLTQPVIGLWKLVIYQLNDYMTPLVMWLIIGWRPNITHLYSLSAYGTERLTSRPAAWEAAVVTGHWDVPPSIASTVLIVTTTSCCQLSECMDSDSGHKLRSSHPRIAMCREILPRLLLQVEQWSKWRGINADFWNVRS